MFSVGPFLGELSLFFATLRDACSIMVISFWRWLLVMHRMWFFGWFGVY